MAIELDHIILNVNDLKTSSAFFVEILGLKQDPPREPFATLRVTPHFTIQLAPFGTKGGEHLAFSMAKADYNAVLTRLKAAGIPYGDRYDSVGNMKSDGEEDCARGVAKGLYFFDPNEHLIEIRHYEA
jgi:catechol 2,3-dioxygenase-like lactoylglutathione lyase family enzyme